MGEYNEWMCAQDRDFMVLICGPHLPGPNFKDYKFKPITLEELQELDEQHIFKESETL